MSDGDTTRETVGPVSHRDLDAWCSERGHFRPERPTWCSRTRTLHDKTAKAWCSRTGTLQAQIPSTASDGLASSAIDPSLEYSTENVVLFWQPRPIFAVVAFVIYRRRRVIFLRGAVYDGCIGQAFKRPSRSGAHHVVARLKRTQTHRSRRAQL